MPITRKQNKPRKSREVEMLSNIEKLHIMLGGNNHKREESVFSNSLRRPKSPSYNTLVNNDVNSHSISIEDEVSGNA